MSQQVVVGHREAMETEHDLRAYQTDEEARLLELVAVFLGYIASLD